jgi:hypothetical protein
MPSLMTIPRELRDQICSHVILSQHLERPALNQTFDELIQHRSIPSKPKLASWCTTVLYHPEDAVANTSSLLRVNHQLRAETLENVKLIKTCTYELDVIILDEILPLPTWLCVPFYTSNVEQINATFRISGCFDKTKNRRTGKDGESPPGPYHRFGRYKGFKGGDGAGPAFGWQIYSILERFLRVGPLGEISGENSEHEDRLINVKTIDINIETPLDVDPARFGYPRSGGYGIRDGDVSDSVLSPVILAGFVKSDMTALLRGRDHEWFMYGQVLFEHVDTVVVRLDGQELARLDVAECFEHAEGFKEHYISKIALEEYKALVWELRKERGLKVPKA